MATVDDAPRFGFGKNWSKFIDTRFSEERAEAARHRILDFMEREDLEGLDFLDIGCGSGLHSLGAFRSSAGRVYSFDYDPNSVATTQKLRERVGSPEKWHVERGDALDKDYIESLGKWNFVYSWGVLHHTGDVWQAIENAQSTVADDGLFYIALYAEDVQSDPQYWLDIKKRYNRATPFRRWLMDWWYVWRFVMGGKLWNIHRVVKMYTEHRLKRGMDMMTDIRDWMGGWPMEFTKDQDVVDLLEQKHGFRLIKVLTGEACTEFLFHRTGVPEKPSVVAELAKKNSLGIENPSS